MNIKKSFVYQSSIFVEIDKSLTLGIGDKYEITVEADRLVLHKPLPNTWNGTPFELIATYSHRLFVLLKPEMLEQLGCKVRDELLICRGHHFIDGTFGPAIIIMSTDSQNWGHC